VAWVGTDEAFQGFIDKHGLTFPQLSDDPGYIFSHFDVPAQPALVIVDGDGTAETFIGAVDDQTLDDILADVAS
jgi:peroxiredoxin